MAQNCRFFQHKNGQKSVFFNTSLEFLASYLKFRMFAAGKNQSLNLGNWNLSFSAVSIWGPIFQIFWSLKYDHSHKSAIFACSKPNCPKKDENIYENDRKHQKNGFKNTLKKTKLCSLRGTVPPPASDRVNFNAWLRPWVIYLKVLIKMPLFSWSSFASVCTGRSGTGPGSGGRGPRCGEFYLSWGWLWGLWWWWQKWFGCMAILTMKVYQLSRQKKIAQNGLVFPTRCNWSPLRKHVSGL